MTGPIPVLRSVNETIHGCADPATASSWRRAVQAWLYETVDIDDELVADIVLAAHEAMANAVDHAYSHADERGGMSLQLAYDQAERAVKICVTDQGQWIDRDQVPYDSTRGRGLALMYTLSDACSIDGTSNGTKVCLHFHHCPPRYQVSQNYAS